MLLLFFDKWVACVSKLHKLCSPQNKNLTDENNRHASVMRGLLQEGTKTILSCPVKCLDCVVLP